MTHDEIQQRIKQLDCEIKNLMELDEQNLNAELQLTKERLEALGAHSINVVMKPEYMEGNNVEFNYMSGSDENLGESIYKIANELNEKYQNWYVWFIWHEEA